MVRKGLLKVCVWEGVGDWTEQKYFDPHSYGRQCSIFLDLQMLNRRPWGPLYWMLAFFTASYQHLLWTPIYSGLPRAPSAGCGFPYHISSISVSNSTATATETRTQLSYVIVQHPLDHPLDLWNRMFNRHHVEITVMHFRGHPLPVRQFMRVTWYLLVCPILLANFRPRDFLSELPLKSVTSFRCITLNGILGRVEGQNITILFFSFSFFFHFFLLLIYCLLYYLVYTFLFSSLFFFSFHCSIIHSLSLIFFFIFVFFHYLWIITSQLFSQFVSFFTFR